MAETLFGIDFSALMSDVFAGQLQTGTLGRASQTIDSYGQAVNTWTESAVEGVVSQWDDKTRVARGYPMEAVRVMILAQGVSRPSLQDRIEIGGATWRIIDVRSGAGSATYEIAGVPA